MPPKVVLGNPNLSRALARMAVSAVGSIKRRAFPVSGRAGRDVRGRAFKRLTERYRKRKRKLGRHGVPDQRLRSLTAQSLGVIRRTRTSRTVGFRARKGIAESLQQRNDFMGLTRRERAALLRIARAEIGREAAKKVRVQDRRIEIVLPI